jgi:hypothetical protein
MKKRGMTTEEVAAEMACIPKTVTIRYHKYGSFYGVVPLKLPSGRLLWPLDTFERITGRSAA